MCDRSVAGGRCVQCLVDGDCPSPFVCDPAGRTCVECSAGHAEACRADLTGAACLPGGKCGCSTDADCGGPASGRLCDATSGRCVPRPATPGDDGGTGTDGGAPDGSADAPQAEAGAPDGATPDAAQPDAPAGDGAGTPDVISTDDGGGHLPGDAGASDGGPDRPGILLGPDGYLAGGGCHCNTGGGAPGGGPTMLALLALVGALRRRRRR
jgi:MYXO-CTERM domain-containing protein